MSNLLQNFLNEYPKTIEYSRLLVFVSALLTGGIHT